MGVVARAGPIQAGEASHAVQFQLALGGTVTGVISRIGKMPRGRAPG